MAKKSGNWNGAISYWRMSRGQRVDHESEKRLRKTEADLADRQRKKALLDETHRIQRDLAKRFKVGENVRIGKKVAQVIAIDATTGSLTIRFPGGRTQDVVPGFIESI